MGRFVNDTTGAIVSVDDSKDHRFDAGWTRASAVVQKPVKSDTPDKSWTVAELNAFATENSVDLGDAIKKDDVVAAIELHLEALTN